MAQPLTCVAGFNVPIRQGKWKITGLNAPVNDSTLDSYILLIDDRTIKETDETGKMYTSVATAIAAGRPICYVKGDGSSYDSTLEWHPSEPIKTIYGISIYSNNTIGGAIQLYVQ